MKKSMIGFFCGLLLILNGCVPAGAPKPESKPDEMVQSAQTATSSLKQSLAGLPGGEVVEVDGHPAVAYRHGELFAPIAVLPLPGGTEVLEPLAELLKEFSGQRWQFLVAARTEQGRDYDVRLAQQRQVLLERFMRKSGVDLQNIEFLVDEASDVPLRVVAVETSQESSSTVGKE